MFQVVKQDVSLGWVWNVFQVWRVGHTRVISFDFVLLSPTNESARSYRRFGPSGFSRAIIGRIEYDMGTGIGTLTLTSLTQAEAHSMEVLGWTCPRLSDDSQRFFGGSFKQNDGYKMLSQVVFQHTIHRHKSLFQLCVWRSSYLWTTICHMDI